MSDCGVCLSGDYDCAAEFSDTSYAKARKVYRCCECHRDIAKGQEYERQVGKWEGDFYTYKTCMDCVNIRTAFACGGGYTFTRLWEDLSEYQRELNTGCLEKIKTPTAKAYFLERLRKWRGIEV